MTSAAFAPKLYQVTTKPLALAAIDSERYQGALEHAVGNLVVDLRDLGRTEQDIAAELNGLPLTDAD